MRNADKIWQAFHKILPYAKAVITTGKYIDWVDIEFGKNFVSIECHENNKYGVILERFDSTPFGRADYFFDNHVEAIDTAIKLLCCGE